MVCKPIIVIFEKLVQTFDGISCLIYQEKLQQNNTIAHWKRKKMLEVLALYLLFFMTAM